ncbi:DUF6255 family natural product biosynthesis protein [Streptomyces sp. NPDC053079]|uniref:DUF6255 family natural product biosynthesis protein n=1 Tax=Streptomyces sp. NPDC053079 TaxID=3365697 RepID=UPI0037CEF224
MPPRSLRTTTLRAWSTSNAPAAASRGRPPPPPCVWRPGTNATRRFTGYGALRPPGLPHARTPSDADRARADRSAALLISRTAYHLRRWRLSTAGAL